MGEMLWDNMTSSSWKPQLEFNKIKNQTFFSLQLSIQKRQSHYMPFEPMFTGC
jgi:hypothetical protein